MRKFLLTAFLGVTGLIILLFLLANRMPVYISLDPINIVNPAFAVGPMPLWAALIAMMFIGYFLGGLGMWLSGKGLRRKASERKHRIKELEHALELANAPRPKKTDDLPVIQRQNTPQNTSQNTNQEKIASR